MALLGFFLNAKNDFTRTTQLGRLGRTGETYAFNEQGMLITESRFDQELIDVGLLSVGQLGILTIDIRDPGGPLADGFKINKPILSR